MSLSPSLLGWAGSPGPAALGPSIHGGTPMAAPGGHPASNRRHHTNGWWGRAEQCPKLSEVILIPFFPWFGGSDGNVHLEGMEGGMKGGMEGGRRALRSCSFHWWLPKVFPPIPRTVLGAQGQAAALSTDADVTPLGRSAPPGTLQPHHPRVRMMKGSGCKDA